MKHYNILVQHSQLFSYFKKLKNLVCRLSEWTNGQKVNQNVILA
jgi:hypothetical protein